MRRLLMTLRVQSSHITAIERARGPPGIWSTLVSKVDRGWFRAVRETCDAAVDLQQAQAKRRDAKIKESNGIDDEQEGKLKAQEKPEAEAGNDDAPEDAMAAQKAQDALSAEKVVITAQLWCMTGLGDWSPPSADIACEYTAVAAIKKKTPATDARESAGSREEKDNKAETGEVGHAGKDMDTVKKIAQLKKKGQIEQAKSKQLRAKAKKTHFSW